jgi:exodeoxyribonuclease V beta subunit
MSSPLSPLNFPLQGSHLIEASAGTGKTFTIAALYVRLVLGHGGPQTTYGRPLTPPEILVVTFTEAATQELRDRIRVRLAQAAAFFRQHPNVKGDPFLDDVRQSYPPSDWPDCAQRLAHAAESMDEAAVFTIHGWCQRMLREHAFDSGSPFSLELNPDPSARLALAVRDYWRVFAYPLSVDTITFLKSRLKLKTPDDLAAALAPLLPQREALMALGPGQPPQAAFDAFFGDLAALKAPWPSWVGDLMCFFDGLRKKKQIQARRFNVGHQANALAALECWRDDPQAILPNLSDGACVVLSLSGIQGYLQNGGTVPVNGPVHDALAACEALPEQVDHLFRQLHKAFFIHAIDWVANRVEQGKRTDAEMNFDDLLIRMEEAITGKNGKRLAKTLRAQFPVALIDEFQDTDRRQYTLFNAVYQPTQNDPDTALILIGDPKQAIYSFRGADIYTYLAAKADTAPRHHTLGTNFRSTQAMVHAVNGVFEEADQRDPSKGAFLFGTDLPFIPVKAQGRSDGLYDEGKPVAALTLWRTSETGKTAAIPMMAEHCAEAIAGLLDRAQQKKAGFIENKQPPDHGVQTPLEPADIAILVNNRHEAALIRKELGIRGVRTVYLSERDSVFEQPEARALIDWLLACAWPENTRFVVAALASPLLDLDWLTLDNLKTDETQFETRLDQFRMYRTLWQKAGVLAMLRRFMHDFQVPQRLLGHQSREGERQLTNLLHLAELLQIASQEVEGEAGLIRYLAEQTRQESQGGQDARQLRLESDADLVKIVTIHKSKGLEYPLVFLPFLSHFREIKSTDSPIVYHDDASALHLSLSHHSSAGLAKADEERLAEDVRKLYVALTRARYAVWIGVSASGMDDSALGHLLGHDLEAGLDALESRLKADVALVDLDAIEDEPENRPFTLLQKVALGAHGPMSLSARTAHRLVRDDWWVASYSALHAGSTMTDAQEEVFAEADKADPVPPEDEVDFSEEEAIPESEEPIHPSLGSPCRQAEIGPGWLHELPRGAATGNLLHALMEEMGRQGFEKVSTDSATQARLKARIERRCALRTEWQGWADKLYATAIELVKADLPCGHDNQGRCHFLRLEALTRFQTEMEFSIATHDVDLGKLDALLHRHFPSKAKRPPLEKRTLNGLLKGFIDLVFEHEGRYYILDYKSDRLGPENRHYTPGRMRGKVLRERYDLQCGLYLLALHRMLQGRLPNYDYDTHIGGGLYLFLRGTCAATRGVHIECPSKDFIVKLDALFS